jgi:hypothetical protein
VTAVGVAVGVVVGGAKRGVRKMTSAKKRLRAVFDESMYFFIGPMSISRESEVRLTVFAEFCGKKSSGALPRAKPCERVDLKSKAVPCGIIALAIGKGVGFYPYRLAA